MKNAKVQTFENRNAKNESLSKEINTKMTNTTAKTLNIGRTYLDLFFLSTNFVRGDNIQAQPTACLPRRARLAPEISHLAI